MDPKENLSVRAGCKDVWNAFMLQGASFSENDIPLCPTTANEIPSRLISYEEAKHIHNCELERGNANYRVIEACTRCKSERVIDIKMSNHNSLLFISFSNSCEDNYSTQDNYSTTKKDIQRHGFGLNNIKRIVEAYGGQMDIVSKELVFIVRIMISSADLK